MAVGRPLKRNDDVRFLVFRSNVDIHGKVKKLAAKKSLTMTQYVSQILNKAVEKQWGKL